MDDINLLYDKIIILKKVLSSKSYISSDFIWPVWAGYFGFMVFLYISHIKLYFETVPRTKIVEMYL